MVFVVHFEFGDEFLDGSDDCGFIGTGHEGVFLLFLEILFSEGQLFVVSLRVLLVSG